MSSDENNNESRFTRVTRESKERRAQADRRGAARRAAEMQEIARQVAARKPVVIPKPAAGTEAEDSREDQGEGIKGQLA